MVLPPSLHPLGVRYQWQVPLPDGPVPKVDPLQAGLIRNSVTLNAISVTPQPVTEDTKILKLCNNGVLSYATGASGINSVEPDSVEQKPAIQVIDSRVTDSRFTDSQVPVPVIQIPGPEEPDSQISSSIDPVDMGRRGPEPNPEKVIECLTRVDNVTWDDPEHFMYRVMGAIERTFPTKPDTCNKVIFTFCRELKAIPELEGVNIKYFKPLIKFWFDKGRSNIDHDFETTWERFICGWPKVKFPVGSFSLDKCLEEARKNPVEYESKYPELRDLLSLCRVLQRKNGTDSFILTCQNAERLLGKDRTQINRWFKRLMAEGWLECTRHGKPKEKNRQGEPIGGVASKYKYLGKL